MNKAIKILINISENKKFSILRRRLVVVRSFLSRAYSWIQTPGFVLILVGVMHPYITPHVDISMWIIAIGLLVLLLVIGFIERYLGFFTEEQTYNTQRNSFLLKKLDNLETKIDNLNKRFGDNGKEEINKETN